MNISDFFWALIVVNFIVFAVFMGVFLCRTSSSKSKKYKASKTRGGSSDSYHYYDSSNNCGED